MKPNSDIRKYVRGRFIKLAAGILLWNAALAVLEVIFIYEYFIRTLNEINAVAFWIILGALPFFLLGGHKLVFSPGWEGKLISIVYDDKIEQKSKLSAGIMLGGQRHYYVNMIVERDNGSSVSFTIDNGLKHREYDYRVGDRLKRFYGTKYPIIIDGSRNICPICGCENDKTDTHCNFCGVQVLKTETNNG